MDRCKREANVERDRETERVLGGGGGSGEGGSALWPKAECRLYEQ